MRPSARNRLWTTWLAILAVALSALVPAVSQALGRGQAAGWLEVCGASGTRWIAADGDSQPAEGSKTLHVLEHCPACSFHPLAPALEPPQGLRFEPAVFVQEVPRAFLEAPRTAPVWVSALSRAPPQRC